ncbi:hypothetical protein K1719_013111 [Acacia pycnantha]|nr:hypothetical protein K1719_012850 [Acacia pycnantha]KAI9116112.1 hypothetical protein K1719_013042 [Acacia pycnantha]KAI9116181.1 hypothetical protein K1719_013111 [Acacia pycnantha]
MSSDYGHIDPIAVVVLAVIFILAVFSTKASSRFNYIDREILKRSAAHFTPGGWCVGYTVLGKDPCAVYGNPVAVKPTSSSKRLEKLLVKVETIRS